MQDYAVQKIWKLSGPCSNFFWVTRGPFFAYSLPVFSPSPLLTPSPRSLPPHCLLPPVFSPFPFLTLPVPASFLLLALAELTTPVIAFLRA